MIKKKHLVRLCRLPPTRGKQKAKREGVPSLSCFSKMLATRRPKGILESPLPRLWQLLGMLFSKESWRDRKVLYRIPHLPHEQATKSRRYGGIPFERDSAALII